jgi:hypothetical protein
MLYIKILFFINFLVYSGLLFSQPAFEFGQNYQVVPQENMDQKFPYAIFDSYGTLHLTWVTDQNGHKDVYYTQSTDGGYSFSEPERLNSHVHTVVAYMQSGPKIVMRGEELVVVFMDDRSGYTSIYINVSPNGGLSWGDDIRVSDQMYLEAYPEIGVGIDGKLHLAYYYYNQNYSWNSVRYATSPPGSIEFLPSVPMGITNEEMEPCDCCQPDMDVAENGDLYFAYRNNISNQRKHFIVKKDFGSEDFQEPIQMSNYNDFVSYCPSSGPSISIEANNIAAGFHVSQHNNAYVNHSSLESLIFTDEVNVNPGSGSSQNFPFVVLKESTIHTAWIDYRNGNPDIYFSSMELGGNELVNEQRISDDPEESSYVQKDPLLVWTGDGLICFWSDNRTGDYQIFMATTGGPQNETITITLNSDWNLVGLPLMVDDSSYEILFPDAIEGTLYGFNESYSLENDYEMGRGYWLRFDESSTTQITGIPIDTLEILLVEGWNLISGNHTEVEIPHILDPYEIIIPGTVYQFDEGYIETELIQPGKGYWVRASSDGIIYFIE